MGRSPLGVARPRVIVADPNDAPMSANQSRRTMTDRREALTTELASLSASRSAHRAQRIPAFAKQDSSAKWWHESALHASLMSATFSMAIA